MSISFTYGLMGSGKTKELIDFKNNLEKSTDNKILVLKSLLDTRDGANVLKSRNGEETECFSVNSFLNNQLPAEHLYPDTIIVDEAQFLTEHEVTELINLSDNISIDLHFYGLLTDFTGNLFEGSKKIMAYADNIKKLDCKCWCGCNATLNARYNNKGIIHDGNQVEVGGDDRYAALCRKHYIEGNIGKEFIKNHENIITEKSEKITVNGHTGTWYVIDTQTIDDKQYFLLEHETYGDEVAGVIVDANGSLILEDVYNGFDDLSDFFDVEANVFKDKMELATIYYTNESINYYNEEIFINAVKENFNTLGVNGWNIEFVSASPALRKEIEDIKCSEFGYSNPYDLEHYEKNDFTLITSERKNELYENWQQETNDEDTQQWRDEITMPQEQALINKWDNGFDEGLHKMVTSTLKASANISARLFVDMDGTLAVFNQVDTLETLYEKGYFANLEPQPNVINAVKQIIKEHPEIEVNILSAVLSDSEFALNEKNAWIDRYLPEIDRAHRIFTPCGEDKKAFIKNINQTDFLLDDYTKNLTLWEPPAKGIKLLNGINDTHGTWKGNKVRFDISSEELNSLIIKCMEPIPVEQKDFLFKDTSQYLNTQSKKPLQPGDIFYSKINIPIYSENLTGKLFVVNEVKADGDFSAYKLTSSDRSSLPHFVPINADNFNHLSKNSFADGNEIFNFPANWQYTKMHGRLTAEQMQAINTEAKASELKTINVGEAQPLTDSDKARQAIDNLYSKFEKDPKELAEYLSFKAKFHNFSTRNALLIYSQNPYSTFVASKTKFNELGYKILPHQTSKAIKALRPVKTEFFYRENGEKVFMSKATADEKEKIKQNKIRVEIGQSVKYAYYNLYDISQTDCPQNEYPSVYNMGIKSEQHKEYYNKIVTLMERMEINVNVKDLRSISLSGYYDRVNNSITINSLLNDTQRLSTISHEAAHALLHKTGTATKEVKEFEAQCLAILFQSELGLPLDKNDVSYLCGYMKTALGQTNFKLSNSIERVTKQVNFLKLGIGLENNQNNFFNRNLSLSNSNQKGNITNKNEKHVSFEY